MLLCDTFSIDNSRRTADGYFAVSARVARGGNVQVYTGSEVGRPDLSTVRVYRPADEVFSKDALQSFAHKPVTLGHPSGPVTADSWKSVAKGWGDGEVARDGEFIRINMLLADAEAIREVEQGTRELSMGYDCELVWGGGKSPSGEAYDAKQTHIRANHIAVVPRARGGSQLRIGDGSPSSTGPRKELHMMTDAEQRTMRDSVRGMGLHQAAALPIYDGLRGLRTSNMPSEQYFAIVDGAAYEPAPLTDEAQRAKAAYDASVRRINDAHRPSGDPATAFERSVHDMNAWRDEAPKLTHARDGRPIDSLSPHDRAREEQIHRDGNAWRR